MRYWFDTEFIEDGKTIDLLSIGIVAENGETFYAESLDADWSRANEWVREHVLIHLSKPGSFQGTREHIKALVLRFIGDDPAPEFWAYYADYDWVALCQLFGRMIDLPKGWPMYCRDIKQWSDYLGNPQLPERNGIELEHHALADARWNREAWAFLKRADYEKRIRNTP